MLKKKVYNSFRPPVLHIFAYFPPTDEGCPTVQLGSMTRVVSHNAEKAYFLKSSPKSQKNQNHPRIPLSGSKGRVWCKKISWYFRHLQCFGISRIKTKNGRIVYLRYLNIYWVPQKCEKLKFSRDSFLWSDQSMPAKRPKKSCEMSTYKYVCTYMYIFLFKLGANLCSLYV